MGLETFIGVSGTYAPLIVIRYFLYRHARRRTIPGPSARVSYWKKRCRLNILRDAKQCFDFIFIPFVERGDDASQAQSLGGQ